MKKILVADREKAFCLLYQEELTEEGYDVVGVTKMEDLMQALKMENPDLLLMDDGMHGKDMGNFLEWMRKSGYGLPIILFTRHAVSLEFPDSLVNDTVVKSSSLDELKFKIRRIEMNGDKRVSNAMTLS